MCTISLPFLEFVGCCFSEIPGGALKKCLTRKEREDRNYKQRVRYYAKYRAIRIKKSRLASSSNTNIRRKKK